MRILCFGDSNTYGFDPCSYFGGRYPADHRWADLLAKQSGWEVWNAGENGREIPRRERELYRIHQMLSECQPIDVLVVMLGSNDLLQGAGPAEVAACMESFLTALPLDRDHIFLVAPPAMALGAWVADAQLVTASVNLAKHYRAMAEKIGVHFADAGKWHITLTYDGVHFSEEGHRAFANGIYQELLQKFMK